MSQMIKREELLSCVMVGSKRKEVACDGGVLVYEDSEGQGSVVLCAPSLGDLRQEYRFLAPRLVEEGYRVLVMDLRGHGESSTGFSTHTPEDIGRDMLQVLDHAGVEKAYLVGCSISAAAIAWVAQEAPERVEKLVMLGGIVRTMPVEKIFRPMTYLLFARPWGAAMWSYYFGNMLFGEHPPADKEAYLTALHKKMKEPGRLRATAQMMRATKQHIADRLSEVTADTLFLVGSKDPDYPDASKEPEVVREMLGGKMEGHVIEGLGHYPHVEQPEEVFALMRNFMKQVVACAA